MTGWLGNPIAKSELKWTLKASRFPSKPPGGAQHCRYHRNRRHGRLYNANRESGCRQCQEEGITADTPAELKAFCDAYPTRMARDAADTLAYLCTSPYDVRLAQETFENLPDAIRAKLAKYNTDTERRDYLDGRLEGVLETRRMPERSN